MGYIRHHAIIVTGGDWNDEIKKAHEFAMKLGCTVTEIVLSPVNGYRTFCVVPDGSKEGWSESDSGDGRRDAFVAYCEGTRYGDGSGPLDWAEVQYGDEERETLVVRHSDERP